jgi:hypothetical protein
VCRGGRRSRRLPSAIRARDVRAAGLQEEPTEPVENGELLPEPAGPLTITKVGSDMSENYPRTSPFGCLRVTTEVVCRSASSSLLRNDPSAVFSAPDT